MSMRSRFGFLVNSMILSSIFHPGVFPAGYLPAVHMRTIFFLTKNRTESFEATYRLTPGSNAAGS
jgi:hypothetical protein